jgi:hypothetical protein
MGGKLFFFAGSDVIKQLVPKHIALEIAFATRGCGLRLFLTNDVEDAHPEKSKAHMQNAIHPTEAFIDLMEITKLSPSRISGIIIQPPDGIASKKDFSALCEI